MTKHILVTGGLGFIGSAFIRYTLDHNLSSHLVNLDLMTYAANLDNLKLHAQDPRYHFIKGDICDEKKVEELCLTHKIDTIVHFAAETHVDRSIDNPHIFYTTNVGGTLSLLEVVRRHPQIHLHHISTDEVYGSLSATGFFTEDSPYRPNSPYSASKAASDHFVRAYTHTYGLSTTISHCTNNYGPGQYVEKFIPRLLSSLLFKQPIPIYGKGENIRDWLFVDDHSSAIWKILNHKESNQTYAIGGTCEYKNIDLAQLLITLFAELRNENKEDYTALLTFVQDRKGHDLRYAINPDKIKKELNWAPNYSLKEGLKKTILWYLENPERLNLL